MQIICRKRLQFVQHNMIDNPATKEKVAIVKASFVVSPSTKVQEVPDWIEKEELFQLAVDEGTIDKIAILSKRSAKPQKEEIPTPVATGWGAKPQSGLALGAK